MIVSDSFINEQNVDWSLTTWEGARREQMRRWAALPSEECSPRTWGWPVFEIVIPAAEKCATSALEKCTTP
jgi:hypothetical protein